MEETILTYNPVLQFLELVLVRTRQETATRVAATLAKFHGVALAATNPRLQMSMRCKLALVSVCDNGGRVAYLGEDVVALVLQFAAPPIVRLVHIKHDTKVLGLARDNTVDQRYIQHVEDKLVSFSSATARYFRPA